MRLDDYLQKLGISPPLPATAESLCRLHVAHLSAFLFENLEIQRRGSIRVDVESVEQKFLSGGGGYCFEHNTLFAAVLCELGFEVTILLGRAGPPDKRALNHMLLRVDIGGQPWIADVGFGGEGLLEPIPLQENVPVMQEGIEYSLRRDGHFWVLSIHYGSTTEDLYDFAEVPHTAGDIDIANYYTSTHPQSLFRRTLTIQRVTTEERLILRPRVITRLRGGTRVDTPIEPSQVRSFARELFGIDLGPAPLLFEET